jgi:excisionase family DNA binding protein
MENESQSLITVDELCEILMIGKNAAYHLLQSGKIKCFRIGRIWKIPRESLDKYIREQSYLLS